MTNVPDPRRMIPVLEYLAECARREPRRQSYPGPEVFRLVEEAAERMAAITRERAPTHEEVNALAGLWRVLADTVLDEEIYIAFDAAVAAASFCSGKVTWEQKSREQRAWLRRLFAVPNEAPWLVPAEEPGWVGTGWEKHGLTGYVRKHGLPEGWPPLPFDAGERPR